MEELACLEVSGDSAILGGLELALGPNPKALSIDVWAWCRAVEAAPVLAAATSLGV